MKNFTFFIFCLSILFNFGCSSTSDKSINVNKIITNEELVAIRTQQILEQKQLIDIKWRDIANKINTLNEYNSRNEYLLEINSLLLRNSDDGFAVLNNFAKEFLPNTHKKYLTSRNISITMFQDIQQKYNQKIEPTNFNWQNYVEQTQALMLCLVDELRLQSDIAYLYLQSKINVISNEDLYQLDNNPKLYTECILNQNININLANEEISNENEILDFTKQYLPQTYCLLNDINKERNNSLSLFNNIMLDAQKIKLLNFNSTPTSLAICKYQYLYFDRCYKEYVSKISNIIEYYNLTYITDDDLSKYDHDFFLELLSFIESSQNYIDRNKSLNFKSIVIVDIIYSMTSIPNTNYMISKFEITQQQWETIMGNNPSHFKGPNLPVENVSWDDCQEFINALNEMHEVIFEQFIFRLPTKEEWEKACRAGSKGNYGYISNDLEGTIDEMGWYNNNSKQQTHMVGQKTPNQYGLYDMHGNVWEWTSSNSGSFKIKCGGSWENNQHFCRSYCYGIENQDTKHKTCGFRLLASKYILDDNN